MPESTSQAVAWTVGQDHLVEKANAKKLANAAAQADGAQREARTIAYIRKHTDLPFVVFNQGFASGESGFVPGMPHEKNIEPALADLRLERVYQNNPAHVHIEVSGTSAHLRPSDHLFIKLEKLRQHQRTGDDKLFMLVYDKMQQPDGRFAAKAVPLAVPADAFDLSGTIADLQKRYPDQTGVHVRQIQGQWMLALPPDTPFRLTKDQFIERIERALNRSYFDRLDPAQRALDHAFHGTLQQDTAQLEVLNARYLQQRAALTLPDNKVVVLNTVQQGLLNKLGALNAPELVNGYRKIVGWPPMMRDKIKDQGR